MTPLDPLSRIPHLDVETARRLHDRLAAAAADADVLDVAYRTVDTPVGTLLLAATSRGLVRIAFELEGRDAVLAQLAEALSPRILTAPGRLDAVARQLDEYFAQQRRSFDFPIDHALSHGFRLAVLQHLSRIGYGQTESYATVAAAAGSPNAVRAVGSACATNPIPIVVPCHRVIRSDGLIGQYLGGMSAKRLLLDLEAAA